MRRIFSALFGIGCLAVAVAQTGAPSDTLPPVQPPPDLDVPPAKAPDATPAKPPTAPPSSAPLIPLANSDAEAQAAAVAQQKAAAEQARTMAQPNFATTPPVDKAALQSPGLPPDVQKAAEATELPVITVRQNGNERVEEYRKRGVLYFVRVVPEQGPPRYYVDQPSTIPPDLTPISGPSGVVQPVYYKLFDWK